MRVVQAFTLQRKGLDAASGILDWILSPIYFHRALPEDKLILYTNTASVELLGELWPLIAKQYDEVYTNLKETSEVCFSSPKFEAIEQELTKYGPDFMVIDNDIYLFPGFKDDLADYCVYYSDGHLLSWYRQIVNNEYARLNAPDWVTWQSEPYNCAVIRLNDAVFFKEYLELFNSIDVAALSTKLLERAVVKEQWSLGELFKKHNIKPVTIREFKKAYHKGNTKMKAKPSHVICVQEYLAAWLAPEAYKVYQTKYSAKNKKVYDINWCLSEFMAPWERDGLMAPIYEKAAKLKGNN